VQILTRLRRAAPISGTQCTCFTSTKVQILTRLRRAAPISGTQCTCFTSTKVQILTRLRRAAQLKAAYTSNNNSLRPHTRQILTAQGLKN
jgi:hypothetical protein